MEQKHQTTSSVTDAFNDARMEEVECALSDEKSAAGDYMKAEAGAIDLYSVTDFAIQEHALNVFGRLLSKEELETLVYDGVLCDYIYPAVQDCLRDVMKE